MSNEMIDMADMISKVKFNEHGLVPVIAQDVESKEVLMLAYANHEALEASIRTKEAHYYSRSRKELWHKGATSGHIQHIEDICYDCDGDAVLYLVRQVGVACHTGERSCFYRSFDNRSLDKHNSDSTLEKLYAVVAGRRETPVEGSYTNYLFEKGIDKILKKVGEECAEVIIAAKNSSKAGNEVDGNAEVSYETADLLYHLTVLLAELDLDWADIMNELQKRA